MLHLVAHPHPHSITAANQSIESKNSLAENELGVGEVENDMLFLE